MGSICGIDCGDCELSSGCKRCAAIDGRPFGTECMVALYCKKGEDELCGFKERLMAAFNTLDIPNMEKVTELNALKGSFANIEYSLPNSRIVKFWDDNKIYFGNQMQKKGSDRCYGIMADETHLMVSEYSGYGEDAEIIVFKRWK